MQGDGGELSVVYLDAGRVLLFDELGDLYVEARVLAGQEPAPE